VFHRGWWLVASVYLVTDANLSASQLLLIGVGQAIIAFIFELPAGVLADTISRKWSLIISHILMGIAMIATGLVTDFRLLVITQMLWGVSWTFASGADVAWITDELNEPKRISGVLVKSERAKLIGAAVGIVGLGILAALTNRSVAMIVAGSAMFLLSVYILFRFREQNFVPTSTKRWLASWSILKQGIMLAFRSRTILVIFAATFLINGAASVGRLYQRRLVDVGLPSDPVIWFAVLGILTLLLGAIALRIIERHIDGTKTPWISYILACMVGVVGLVVLAFVPEKISGSVAILLVAGFAVPIGRTMGTILVNQKTSSSVRATVHSLLAQAKYLGEIILGLVIAVVAGLLGISMAFLVSAALFTVTAFLIWGFLRMSMTKNIKNTMNA